MTYEHTQKAPLYYLLMAVGAAMVIGAWAARETLPVVILLCVVAALTFLLAASFRELTVRDEGDHLAIRFGPLPLFFRRIPYAEITNVLRTRSSVIDGWGIHYIPGRGTTYNLYGFDCVELRLGRSRVLAGEESERMHGFDCVELRLGRPIIRVGTDDADNLAEFLKAKMLNSG